MCVEVSIFIFDLFALEQLSRPINWRNWKEPSNERLIRMSSRAMNLR